MYSRVMSNAVLHPEANGSEQSDSMRTGRSPSFRLTRGEWAVFIAVLIFYAVTRL